MPGFPSVLLRTLRDLRERGRRRRVVRCGRRSEAADPTGKLSALAAMYAEHERRRAGFFSSEDGLTVAEPAGRSAPDRLLVYGVWEPSALLLSALDALLARGGGDGVAAAGPSGRRGGASRRFVDWAAGARREPELGSSSRRIARAARWLRCRTARPARRTRRQRRARLGARPDARGAGGGRAPVFAGHATGVGVPRDGGRVSPERAVSARCSRRRSARRGSRRTCTRGRR